MSRKETVISSPITPLAYMLDVIADPLSSRERRDAMAKAVLDHSEGKTTESETVTVLGYGMIEAGSAAVEKLERLLSGSP